MLAYNWARTQKQDMILVTNALIHNHFFAVELLLLSPAVYVFFSFFGVGVVGIIQAIKRFFQELDGYVIGYLQSEFNYRPRALKLSGIACSLLQGQPGFEFPSPLL